MDALVLLGIYTAWTGVAFIGASWLAEALGADNTRVFSFRSPRM